ncbi:MAG: RES family NAD+ phosphorylase [Niabella sp.]
MIIYRLVRSEYKSDLSGYSAFLYGGRWNNKGQYALYGAGHISLAVLEIVVNYDRSTALLPAYHLIEIEVSDEIVIEIDTAALKKNWASDTEYTQFIGDQFIQTQSGPTLKVPSAVIPEESNFLINPAHNDFKKMKVKNVRPYGLDNRLF